MSEPFACHGASATATSCANAFECIHRVRHNRPAVLLRIMHNFLRILFRINLLLSFASRLLLGDALWLSAHSFASEHRDARARKRDNICIYYRMQFHIYFMILRNLWIRVVKWIVVTTEQFVCISWILALCCASACKEWVGMQCVCVMKMRTRISTGHMVEQRFVPFTRCRMHVNVHRNDMRNKHLSSGGNRSM